MDTDIVTGLVLPKGRSLNFGAARKVAETLQLKAIDFWFRDTLEANMDMDDAFELHEVDMPQVRAALVDLLNKAERATKGRFKGANVWAFTGGADTSSVAVLLSSGSMTEMEDYPSELYKALEWISLCEPVREALYEPQRADR